MLDSLVGYCLLMLILVVVAFLKGRGAEKAGEGWACISWYACSFVGFCFLITMIGITIFVYQHR